MSVKIGNDVAIVMSEGGVRRFESTYSTKDEKIYHNAHDAVLVLQEG